MSHEIAPRLDDRLSEEVKSAVAFLQAIPSPGTASEGTSGRGGGFGDGPVGVEVRVVADEHRLSRVTLFDRVQRLELIAEVKIWLVFGARVMFSAPVAG